MMINRKPLTLLLSTGLVTLLTVVLVRDGWMQASASVGAPAQDRMAQVVQDQDGDGLPDDWETAHGLNPRVGNGINGSAGDPDRDDMSNGDEWANGTDPQNADTDGDGLPDQWEVETLVDPLQGDEINGPDGDPDNDGLLNRDEMGRGADPHNADSDGDGMPDGYEVVQGIQPNDNRGNSGAMGDRNGDGETNLAEFRRFNKYYSPPAAPAQVGRQ